MIYCNDGGELRGPCCINHMTMKIHDGVVKKLTMNKVNMTIEKYCIIHVQCIEYKVKLDKTSEVIINDVKIPYKYKAKL